MICPTYTPIQQRHEVAGCLQSGTYVEERTDSAEDDDSKNAHHDTMNDRSASCYTTREQAFVEKD